MISLKNAIEIIGLSQAQIGEMLGVSKTTISLIANGNYTGNKNKESEIVNQLVQLGYLSKEQADIETITTTKGNLKVDSNKFVITENTIKLDELAKDLLNPNATLNSSIGVVYGHAGYGKSTAIQHFCALNGRASYTLYMEGYTLAMMVRDIVTQLKGTPAHGLDNNISLIKEACMIYRKLIVVDEADRLPLKNIEMLRNINEKCSLPILLVGEHSLSSKMTSLPRLESRIRSTPVIFQPLTLMDIVNYYKQACGLDISTSRKIQQRILKNCHGDFRIMVNDAHRVLAIMNANGLNEITMEVMYAINR